MLLMGIALCRIYGMCVADDGVGCTTAAAAVLSVVAV